MQSDLQGRGGRSRCLANPHRNQGRKSEEHFNNEGRVAGFCEHTGSLCTLPLSPPRWRIPAGRQNTLIRRACPGSVRQGSRSRPVRQTSSGPGQSGRRCTAAALHRVEPFQVHKLDRPAQHHIGPHWRAVRTQRTNRLSQELLNAARRALVAESDATCASVVLAAFAGRALCEAGPERQQQGTREAMGASPRLTLQSGSLVGIPSTRLCQACFRPARQSTAGTAGSQSSSTAQRRL
jgi:hypothetical protein